MEIASHNSWSFLPVRQWWLRPFAWMARCQSLNIEQQYYNHHIRHFDLRMRFDKDGNFVACHGLVNYRGNITNDLDWLNGKVWKENPISVRILFDFRNGKNTYDEVLYTEFINYLRVYFPALTILSCRSLPEWEKLADVPDAEWEEYSASKAKPRLWGLFPWLYAKTHNKKLKTENLKLNTQNNPILLDFIQY